MVEETKEPFNPYDASRKEAVVTKPSVPDFVTKTKEYIKQHPEVIREVAGDEIAKVEEYLDTLPLGLGDIGKAKLNEFLGSGNGSGVQEEVKESAGLTNAGLDGQGQEEQPENEPEDFMTTQDVRDVIEFMADLSEQGFSLPDIADAVWRDYRVEYHPLKIKRMLKAYYARPEDETEPDIKNDNKSLKIFQKLLERNSELQKKVFELNTKVPQEVVKETAKPEKKGVIRRFIAWAW